LAKLRYLNKVPENGIVYFTGAVDIGANQTSMESDVLIPPEPIVSYKYHCDSIFDIEPLEEMLRECSTYGLILLDLREATIGMLIGKQIDVIRHLHSTVPGKQRKGGQSAHRFEQLRHIAIHDFYKRIGDAASEAFLEIEPGELKGILIGGHSPTKEEFNEGEFQRWLAESVWFPTNLLPSERLQWSAITTNTAKLTFNYNDLSVTFFVSINNSGEITQMETTRFMEKDKKEIWICKMADYKNMNGILIPTTAEALWKLDNVGFIYERFIIVKIEDNKPMRSWKKERYQQFKRPTSFEQLF
jgi:hypothetical protein